MKRRDFIASLLLVSTVGRAHAQQTGKIYRIAVVDPSNPVVEMRENGGNSRYHAFFEELRQLGYFEGYNLVAERYSGEGRAEHYPELAREVVRRNPDLICAVSYRLVLDFKAITATIPIVGITGDPVALGIVSSLARPDANITGVSVDAGSEIFGKRLELLREAIPFVSRVGFLASREPWEGPRGVAMREAAKKVGISLISPLLDAPFQEAEYRRVFEAIAQEGAAALILSDQTENWTNRRLIIELAEQGRLPAMYPWPEFAEVGGFMAYGLDLANSGRRAAGVVDRILKGARPGEIAISQPTKFELRINLRTAKRLGIEMPSSLLARADKVIE